MSLLLLFNQNSTINQQPTISLMTTAPQHQALYAHSNHALETEQDQVANLSASNLDDVELSDENISTILG